MPSVRCSLTSCAYRGKRGACTRKHIVLQQDDPELNEMFCLGWATPETRLFEKMITATEYYRALPAQKETICHRDE